MKNIMLPLGVDNFEELRTTGYYYIDKTYFIEELIQERFKVHLITRPRRFGKHLQLVCLRIFLIYARTTGRFLKDWQCQRIKNFAGSGEINGQFCL